MESPQKQKTKDHQISTESPHWEVAPRQKSTVRPNSLLHTSSILFPERLPPCFPSPSLLSFSELHDGSSLRPARPKWRRLPDTRPATWPRRGSFTRRAFSPRRRVLLVGVAQGELPSNRIAPRGQQKGHKSSNPNSSQGRVSVFQGLCKLHMCELQPAMIALFK